MSKNNWAESLTTDQLNIAQQKLDELCQQEGIKAWNIQSGSGKARWRELVLSLCGIKIKSKKAGRPSKGEDYDASIANQVLISEVFSPIREGTSQTKPKEELTKVAISNTKKRLSSSSSKHKGITEDSIRASRARHLKRVASRTEADWSAMADSEDTGNNIWKGPRDKDFKTPKK